MGCADSRYLKKNLAKSMELFEKLESENEKLLEDLKSCSEINNRMVKILKSMKDYLEREQTVEGAVRSKRNEESDDLWERIDAIDITIPNELIRPSIDLPAPTSNDDALIWGITGGVLVLLTILFTFLCLKKIR